MLYPASQRLRQSRPAALPARFAPAVLCTAAVVGGCPRGLPPQRTCKLDLSQDAHLQRHFGFCEQIHEIECINIAPRRHAKPGYGLGAAPCRC
jgi:hypothetical protein